MLLLAELQDALAALGVRSVLARNHRLVLHYNHSPCEPSGLTNPELHIFAADGTDIVTTDGGTYRLANGNECPAGDPAAAATVIGHGPPTPTKPDRKSPAADPGPPLVLKPDAAPSR